MPEQNWQVEAILAALHSRVSVGELTEPAPSEQQRSAIFRAALRAPDHGQLRPWRFLLVEGEDRATIGNILADVEAQCYGVQTEAQRNKAAARLLRAPLVLLIVARITPHTKIPDIEQMMSVAAAVQNMLLAAHALGVGAMWRSGIVTYEPLLAEKLGLAADERLLGFLYLGTPKGEIKPVPALDVNNFFKPWKVL
ncbi:MAG TPA: nitroreductase [Pseudomonadales bacterium]|nr:nitroreductase [Pseudomonadales bacterium]